MSGDVPGAVPPPDAGSLQVGSVLAGRYRIVRKLGEGAMGAVYEAEHLAIGRRDAIKVLRESLAADPEAMARFARGARNVSRIQHANVCTVYDFSTTDDGRRFMAMEFVPGETLQDLLAREGRLAPERAVSIAVQVAGALQAAHEAGIVHRDLKPGNVMIAPGRAGSEIVKVVDFDIAKGSAEGEPGEVTRLGFVIGTPEYMSPEQLLGMALDGRSDVYALGLVLFRMLAGALPFRANDTQELMVQRLTGTPLRLDDVVPGHGLPAALQEAMDRALQRRAEDRFASAADFADAVARALAASAAPVLPLPVTLPAGAPVAPPVTGNLPATVLAERAPDGGSRSGRRLALPTSPAGRAALAAAVVLVVAGGAWGTRALTAEAGSGNDIAVADPPKSDGTGIQQPPPVTPPPVDSSKPLVDSTATAGGTTTGRGGASPTGVVSATPTVQVEAGKGTRGPRGTRGPGPISTTLETRDPDVVEERPPRPIGSAADNASALAQRLSGHIRPGLSPGALRAIADSANSVLALGSAVPAQHRADAAFVLGVVAFQEADWAACVRSLERAEELNSASTRRGRRMLDTCRERQQ